MSVEQKEKYIVVEVQNPSVDYYESVDLDARVFYNHIVELTYDEYQILCRYFEKKSRRIRIFRIKDKVDIFEDFETALKKAKEEELKELKKKEENKQKALERKKKKEEKEIEKAKKLLKEKGEL